MIRTDFFFPQLFRLTSLDAFVNHPPGKVHGEEALSHHTFIGTENRKGEMACSVLTVLASTMSRSSSPPADTSPPNPGATTPMTQQNPTADGGLTFADLPPELREMIWRFALPEMRVFNALVWASTGLKMQLLDRGELKMPLAHVCFESRRVVRESGYVLAFRDEDEPDDPGVWFHPRRDIIERTIWGPGDFWNL
ncbi:hypothetical protein F4778DRAFT_793320 [Xylariomycetidae sp. FL2044]|nr:hypothetical protein F4778DRAFT_793320 [Xylariomycetidae sp. FL2044]